MKRIFLSFAFLLALGAAFITNASTPKLTDFYWQANPNDIENTCKPVDCVENAPLTCTLMDTGYSTYKSVDSQPECHTLKLLKQFQQ